MILLHSVDVYQHIHVLWTKYVLNWIVWTLCSVTTPFLLEFMDHWTIRGFICEFLQFVIVYLVVGGLTKTLTVPAVLIVS